LNRLAAEQGLDGALQSLGEMYHHKTTLERSGGTSLLPTKDTQHFSRSLCVTSTVMMLFKTSAKPFIGTSVPKQRVKLQLNTRCAKSPHLNLLSDDFLQTKATENKQRPLQIICKMSIQN
jgi:hypothetical protein